MKESLPIISVLDNKMNIEMINQIGNLLESNRLVIIDRNYLFDDNARGYVLGHAINSINGLESLIIAIETVLSSVELLKNARIIERGIGINRLGLNITVESAKNYYDLDHVMHHVRIPIRGKSTFNNTSLEIGNAYIIDNISGFKFEASDNTIHIVFNYLGIKNLYPWDLWSWHQ